LISDELPDAASDMGAETIVVAGAKFGDGQDGFILLEDRAGRAPLDNAHGEDLQDHTCGVAH
jgi:CDP-diacylglycerol pyrophosphatase